MPRLGATSPRFTIEAPLGAGASGVVYRAFDHERGHRLALKAIRPSEAHHVQKLCEELRALRHPGLVALYDVVTHEDGQYLAMELVEGDSLLAYVRPNGELSSDRLRTAIVQLIEALEALHARRKVHRDVKPSNIRVRPDGRVVLLDFGLVADAHASLPELQGTLAYAAPEQLVGEEVGPAADFYSLGAVLFEAASGRLPFDLEREALLREKVRGVVPALVVPDLDPGLISLAISLLDPDPEARPSAREALRRLGVGELRTSSASERAPLLQRRARFVGREAELHAMRSLLNGGVTLLWGTEGAGKTTLVSRFKAELGRQGTRAKFIELSCPALRREPFVTLRPLALSLSEGPVELDARTRVLLAKMFAVFIPTSPASHESVKELDRMEARWRALDAMANMMVELEREVPLVVVFDHIEQADADTRAAVLRLVAGARGANVSFLFVSTTEQLSLPLTVDQTIAVHALSDTESSELLVALRQEQELLSEEHKRHYSGALPFEIEERVRCEASFGRATATPPSIEELILLRIEKLDPQARALLEVLCIAQDPLPRSVLAQAGLVHDDTRLAQMLAQLRDASYVVPHSRHRDSLVEITQRKIGRVVRASLSPARIAELVERLSYACAAVPGGAYVLAGLPEAHVPRALLQEALSTVAREAEAVFAFRLHVDCLERLWKLAGRPSVSSAEIGEALACASEPRLAAGRLVLAADSAQGALRLELLQRATELALSGGDAALGLFLLDRVLHEVGQELTPSTTRSLAHFLYNRARIRVRGLSYVERSMYDVSRNDIARIDVLWMVGKLMSMVDLVRGADYQARALLAALSLGEPTRVARALCLEALLSPPESEAELEKATAIVERAEALAKQHGDGYTLAFAAFVRGAMALSLIDAKRALPHFHAAERALRDRADCATWERASVQVQLLLALAVLGDYGALQRHGALFLREAEERGDQYSVTHIVLMSHFRSALMRDRPDEALAEIERALSAWDVGTFQVQHFLALAARAEVALYTGDMSASDSLESLWPRFVRSGLSRVPLARVYARLLRGLVALLAARQDRDRERKLALALRIAREAERESHKSAHAHAAHLRAGACAVRGDKHGAVVLLRRALLLYKEAGVRTWTLDLEYSLGFLLGGDEGEALMQDALSSTSAFGYRAPKKQLSIGGAPFGPF